MILMASDQLLTLPILQRVLPLFSNVSYYKLKEHKAQILALNVLVLLIQLHLQHNYPCTWGLTSIQYLWI